MSYVMHQITQQIDFYKSPLSMKYVMHQFQLLSCLFFLFTVHNDMKIYLARSSARTTTNKRDIMENKMDKHIKTSNIIELHKIAKTNIYSHVNTHTYMKYAWNSCYILFRGYKNVLVAVHHVLGALWLVKTPYIKSQFHRQKENIFSKFTTFQKVIQKQFGSLILVDIKVLSAFL